ncbi:MAG: hypothetical protein Nk1A_8640 [Endomicrobiia bacterium]|nr:MAG: hypothetical protein Nk1A_8640 [Endomicrobiia bacterium]
MSVVKLTHYLTEKFTTKSGLVTISATPNTELRLYPAFKRTVSIDFSRFGNASGGGKGDNIAFDSYRYYVDDDAINLDFSIGYYPIE